MKVRFTLKDGAAARPADLKQDSVLFATNLEGTRFELRMDLSHKRVFNGERDVGTFFVNPFAMHAIEANLVDDWWKA